MSEQNKIPNVSLVDVLRKTKTAIKKEINCIKVGKINSFDAAKQQAEVEIVISKILSIDSEGVKTVRKYPLLVEVPSVVIGGGSAYLQMPINKGDTCLVLFNDDDLDGWITNNETTPYTNRKHDLTDAFCLVGVNNETQTRMAFDDDGVKLFFSDTSFIKLNSDGIGITGDVVCDNKLEVTEDVMFKANLTVLGTSTLSVASVGQLSVTGGAPSEMGGATFTGSVDFSGGVTVGGVAGATGASTPTGVITFVNGIATVIT